jgi:hypothetical protein
MKTIIGIMILISGWISGYAQNNHTEPNKDLLTDARKSLSGATAMSLLSLVSQGVGYVMVNPNISENNENPATGIMLSLGGIGMQTNTPILLGRAGRQVKKWECPNEDLMVKQKILNNIHAAQAVSLIRCLLPVAGIMAGTVVIRNESGSEKTSDVFFGCWLASMVLTIPEIILIENSNGLIKNYQQKLNLGVTEQGIGMIYKF